VPLPLSFPLPPATLLGLAWLMVGCWLCQCEPNNDSEYQRSSNSHGDQQSDDDCHYEVPRSSQCGTNLINKREGSAEGNNSNSIIVKKSVEEPKPGPSSKLCIPTNHYNNHHETKNNSDHKSNSTNQILIKEPISSNTYINHNHDETDEESSEDNILPVENQRLLTKPQEDDLFDNNELRDNKQNNQSDGGRTSTSILGQALPFLKKIWKKSD